ncbi:HPF/RaiA family ribosome-associated protein [Albibacterium indicum]|uniref:HPF/RaiA family ribosome-associated protein n=1 Tax=Albibacterium indicum TaxID=2292082 RepID=UPI000E4ABD86|nr:HPF/RaiA family ribosome-associated protein [Pedobacter indicus]
MNITVQSIHFDADRKLIDFIQRKASKLTQFYDQLLDGVCYLKLENGESEANKIAEFKINIPGNQLFAKGQAKSFEEATDLAVESLRRQINKQKTRENRTILSNHKDVLVEIENKEDI